MNIDALLIQLAPTVVAITATYLKNRADIIKLQARVGELESENEELQARLTRETDERKKVQLQYETALRYAANQRDSF